MIRNSMLFALSLSLLLLVGCDGNVRLKGKVIFSDDNSPVPTGTVNFKTDKYQARGSLNPDGTFAVGSKGNTDGLPAGTYQVYFSNTYEVVGKCELGIDVYGSLIDEKYANYETSDITIEVTPSKKYVEFVVDRNKRTAKK